MFLELGLRAVLVNDEDAREDRLVELAAHVVAGCAVELIGVSQQFEPALKELRTDTQVVFNGSQAGLEPGAFPLDLGDLLAGLRSSQSSIGDEVNQVVDPGLKPCDLPLDLVSKLTTRTRLVLKRIVDLAVHPLDELRPELHHAVVLDDLVLDEIERDVA
ncbi:hypothetical protein [Microcella flavibacter]|uniref:hypothetical protein n=1 Tax=Microcella flavibacter TaxID=1804990 RepID=UPI001457067C|nr:hypothetical protein [Microcella flavibacter]